MLPSTSDGCIEMLPPSTSHVFASCSVVIVGKTKSLDFLEEEKNAKQNKSQAAVEQKQQQFQ